MILNYLQTNWVEITGAVLSLIYLYLSIKQNINLWIFGFLASAFYIVVFFRTGFYADMSLQLYYLVVSVYGWTNWKYGTHQPGKELPATNIPRRQIPRYALASAVIYLAYYIILAKFTDSTIPIADSIVGTLSVTGTLMLARKYIENWLVWIVADALATALFFYKGLYPTAIIFVIYTIMAVVGFFQWKKAMA
ncbi:MAG TPA: nicotinamide riboside transporter PnuC [Paludibacter sp.]|nr:nicotinamide riboside transporter PnuC [Paludibacter sp.]